MPYAVIVPGINTVLNDWAEVERLCALYPYPKFRKFRTAEECWEYVKRHTSRRLYTDIVKYGDTFDNLYVTMEYFICEDRVCYNFKTKKFGYISVECRDPNVKCINKNGVIKVIMSDIHLNDDLINSHMIAIWHGLRIIGEYIDVDIKVPDHSIFYTLMSYKGQNRTINRVKNYIDGRLAKVSVSMKDFGTKEVSE